MIYNILVKRRKLLSVNIGLLYNRSPQNCSAALRVWVSAADTWSFCAPFCPGIRDTGKLCIAVLQWSDLPLRRSTRNTHASSLLPAKLTHPLGQQQERGSSWCDPYSLTAKRARGWEGGAAEWWVEHQQRIEEAFTATAPGGDISLSTVQHPFIHHYTIHPAMHFHKDYIQTWPCMCCRKHQQQQ